MPLCYFKMSAAGSIVGNGQGQVEGGQGEQEAAAGWTEAGLEIHS